MKARMHRPAWMHRPRPCAENREHAGEHPACDDCTHRGLQRATLVCRLSGDAACHGRELHGPLGLRTRLHVLSVCVWTSAPLQAACVWSMHKWGFMPSTSGALVSRIMPILSCGALVRVLRLLRGVRLQGRGWAARSGTRRRSRRHAARRRGCAVGARCVETRLCAI